MTNVVHSEMKCSINSIYIEIFFPSCDHDCTQSEVPSLTIIAAGFFREDKAGVLLQLSWQRDGVIWEQRN